ncbi:hypothetical protein HU200_026531 [Digitaria exilis]|uniref:Uncharacterized protein n=1 Tax=Digitaria exilis TaxID=1010633 RepID=A0A835C924_9POAL|nr:hypothetical protein HU200_026531 [Digitaria exilis]
MRGSADAVAVARDVASSSPSKPAPAFDMLRYSNPPNPVACRGTAAAIRSVFSCVVLDAILCSRRRRWCLLLAFRLLPADLRSFSLVWLLRGRSVEAPFDLWCACSRVWRLYQRPPSDCLPLPNGIAADGSGSGSSGTKKPPAAPAPRSSKDDDAAAAAAAVDSSRLAAFLASTSLEPRPRARAPQQPPAAQTAPSSSPAAVAIRSPARDHGSNHHHHQPDFSDPASPSAPVTTTTGGGEVLLQWGQNKRSRGRRDGASGSGASPLRRQPGAKIQRRSSPSPADKLMPPPSGPSYTRGSNLRAASPLPPRSGAGIGTSDSSQHSRGALPHHHHRSAEERGKSPAAGKQQRQAAAPQQQQHKLGLGPVMGLGVPDIKAQQQYHHHHQGGGGASSSSKPAPKLELPRIYTTLSRKEKEEDFLAMKGTKLPQRPKRRPKNVEKTINVRATLSPRLC